MFLFFISVILTMQQLSYFRHVLGQFQYLSFRMFLSDPVCNDTLVCALSLMLGLCHRSAWLGRKKRCLDNIMEINVHSDYTLLIFFHLSFQHLFDSFKFMALNLWQSLFPKIVVNVLFALPGVMQIPNEIYSFLVSVSQ